MVPNAWWQRWLVWLGIGVVLFVWAGLALLGATQRQEAEQQRRDAYWAAVNAKALRSNPPMLPGEKKPEPAPLEGRGMIALLAIAATGAVARAGWLWLERLRVMGSQPGEETSDPSLDRIARETGWGQGGTNPPPPPSRSGSSTSPGPSPVRGPGLGPAPGPGPGTPPVASPSPRGEPPFRPLPAPPPPPQAPRRPGPPGASSGHGPDGRQNG